MFTKQHYKVIADAIKRCTISKGRISKPVLLEVLCHYFSAENYRFNEEYFRLACGEEIKDAR